jgi:hypothetical protein
MFSCNVTVIDIPNPKGKKNKQWQTREANSSLKKGRKLFIGQRRGLMEVRGGGGCIDNE